MGSTAANALPAVHERQWPPALPFEASFGGYDRWRDVAALAKKSRDLWGAEDWCLYAGYLEVRGCDLLRDLQNAEIECAALRRKLTRKRTDTTPPSQKSVQTLSGPGPVPRARRGRKESARWKIAEEIINIREELRARRGKPVTNKAAAEEWASRRGLKGWRAADHRSVMNDVAKLNSQNAWMLTLE